MRIDISPILSGETSLVRFCFELDASQRPDIVPKDVSVTGAISVSGEIKSVGDYMFLSCLARTPYKTRCARCTKELEGVFEASVEKEIGEDEDGDFLKPENGFVDCSEPVFEEILLNFPTKLLCTPDCRGICPGCGTDLNEARCTCKKQTDPRLAPLLELLRDGEESGENGEK